MMGNGSAMTSDPMERHDDEPALLAVPRDIDVDLEFFHELFLDLPGSAVQPSVPPPASGPGSRRRQRRCNSIRQDTKAPETVPPFGWKQLADQEKRGRMAAEAENARLRKLARIYTRTAQRMWQLTEKATRLSSREYSLAVVPRAVLSTPFVGPPVDLAQLMRDLDTLTAMAEATIASREHASPEPHTCVVENRIVQTATGAVLESTVDMAWLLPFDGDSIARVVLANSIRLVTKKNERHVRTVYEAPTVKVVHAMSPEKEKIGRRTVKHSEFATRVEPVKDADTRLLIVATRGGFTIDSKMALSIEGGGFVHITSVPGHDRALLGPLSRVHWHRRIRANLNTTSQMDHSERARWISTVIAHKQRKAQRQVDKIALAIENLMLGVPK